MLSKGSLDYIISGLKDNIVVTELSLADNGLDDEDLLKISERLAQDSMIKKLKLHSNNFEDPEPFLELLSANGAAFTHIDFSNMRFQGAMLKRLPEALICLKKVEELAMCNILSTQ